MRVDLYPTAGSLPADLAMEGRIAVAIDVLRATTTIVTALENGAEAVMPLLTPEEARLQVVAAPGQSFLLGGERHSVLIEGFDLSNSPLDYTRERVLGKTILFTTTNGTRAIHAAARAEQLFVACLRNAPAIAEALRAQQRDVVILCAGTHEQFSLEDTGCAGAILAALSGVPTNDLGYAALQLYGHFAEDPEEMLRRSTHGQSLLALGLEEDIRFAAAVGASIVLPQVRGSQIRL